MAIVGSVGVEVTPVVKSFSKDLRAKLLPEADKLGQQLGQSLGRNMRERLGIEMKGLPNAKVGLDDSEATRQIAELRAKLDALGRKRETATVRVDTSNASRNIDSLVSKINGKGGLLSGLLALAPAAVPVGAAVVGATVAMGGAFAAATPVVGVFALAIKDSVKQTELASTALIKSHNNVAKVRQQFGGAATSLTLDYNEVARSLTHWDTAAALPAVAKVEHTLMPAIRVGLKAMTPLVKGAGDAFATLGTMISKAVTGPGGTKFIKFLEVQGPRAIVGFGKAIGHIGSGFAGILEAFAPFQKKMLGGLDSLTGRFATWGQNLGSSSSFHKFIAYVRANGPQLGKLLQTAGAAVVALVKAAGGFGAGELKTMTAVLGGLVKFATAHPNIAKMAVATLALAKAVQVLKIASIGGGIVKVLSAIAKFKGPGTIGGLPGGGGGRGVPGGVSGGGLGGGAGVAAGGTAASLSGAIPPLIVGAVLAAVDKYERGKHPAYGNIANALDTRIPPSLNPGQNQTTAALTAFSIKNAAALHVTADVTKNSFNPLTTIFSAALGLFFPKTHQSGPPKPPKPSGPPNIPVRPGASLPTHGILPYINPGAKFTPPPNIPGGKTKIGVDSSAATLAILRVQKALGLIPKNKNVTLGSPGAKTTQRAIDNVYLAQHHLPGTKSIKVTAPGGNLSALTLVNVGRAAKNLKPVARVNVSAPGATGARASINNLLHASGLLPKSKNIKTGTPGAKQAILDFINLDRKAHGLKPLVKIPTSAPGADKAVQLMISLAKRAGILPKDKKINTSTPGAKDAAGQLTRLLQRANVLPKGKHIPTDVPGAKDAILKYIDLYEKAHHLPVDKKIPTTAPHADSTIQQMIDLARKIGIIPKSHSTNISTPGVANAAKGLDGIKNKLNNLKGLYNIHVAAQGTWSADQHASPGGGLLKNAEGGPIRGAGGPKQDNILSWVSNGEWVQPAATVSHYGEAAMESVRQRKAMIIPHFADGGRVSSQLPIHASVAGMDGIASGAKGLLKTDENAMGKIWKAAVSKFLSSFGGSSGGGNAASWIPVIAQALGMLGQPVGLASLWANTVIAHESGGNALAVNRTDINAQEGHPSVGGNQVIAGTFAAYAGPFRNVGPFIAGVSVNRLANTFAALNYAIHAYGSIANTPGIRSLQSGGGYRPYATGGPVPGSGNRDTVPAMLTPGEYVLSKPMVGLMGGLNRVASMFGGGSGNGFFHAGGPVLGIHYGAVGEWVKALAIQARQLSGAFHQAKWDSRVSTDVAGHSPHALPALGKRDPKVKELVAYLWGRHNRPTTFDDALAHFSHDAHPMAFLDITRAYAAGKGYLTKKGFIGKNTLAGFTHGLSRYTGLYHHDVQALEHKLKYKPENGVWSSGLDGPAAHAIAHALHKPHSQFAPRPWDPLNAGEKTLQSVLKSNAQTAELNKDLNQFVKWGFFDLVENLSGGDSGGISMLPTARAAAKNKGLANKLNAAYKVADRTTGINPLVNLGYSAIKYDNGGYIQPGHLAVNLSGHPEAVLNPKQTANLEKLAARSSGPTIHIEHQHINDGSDWVAAGRQMAFTLSNAGL